MTTDEFFGNPAINTYLSGAVTDKNIIRPVIELLGRIDLENLEKILNRFSPNSRDLTWCMKCLRETVQQEINRKKGEAVVV